MKEDDFVLMNKFRMKGFKEVYRICVGAVYKIKNGTESFEAFYLPPDPFGVTFHKSTVILGQLSSTEIILLFSEMELVEKFGLFSEESPGP